jgi:hypothetical protein
MVTLNITIGGNLEIVLDKGAKQELKELIDKASNTDYIIADLLEVGNYLGNDWHMVVGCLTEAPIIGYGAIYEQEELEDYPIDYDKTWYFANYQLESFAEKLLKEKRVIFQKA